MFAVFKESGGEQISSLSRLSRSSGLSCSQIRSLMAYLSNRFPELAIGQFNQLVQCLVPAEPLEPEFVSAFLLGCLHRLNNCISDKVGWVRKCENAAQNAANWVNCKCSSTLRGC